MPRSDRVFEVAKEVGVVDDSPGGYEMIAVDGAEAQGDKQAPIGFDGCEPKGSVGAPAGPRVDRGRRRRHGSFIGLPRWRISAIDPVVHVLVDEVLVVDSI
jgi:hypothetical protein